MPPGVRYGRCRPGSRRRSTRCESDIRAYEMVAPKTATFSIRAPSPVAAASPKPIAPGTSRPR